MNKIIVTGRLTKDGEVRTTDADLKIYNSSIAVNRPFKNKDGNYDADFFNFVLFKPHDNLLKYLKKGQAVLLEGRLQSRNYEDKDGNKKYVTEIIVSRIELTGSSGKSDTTQPAPDVEVPQNYSTEYSSDDSDIVLTDADLPF